MWPKSAGKKFGIIVGPRSRFKIVAGSEETSGDTIFVNSKQPWSIVGVSAAFEVIIIVITQLTPFKWRKY